MNKTIFKIVFATVCLLGIQSLTSSSLLIAGEKIPLIRHDGSNTPLPPNRTPDLAPIVEINDAGTQLTFTGTAPITFSVEIVDEDNNTVLTDTLAVQQNGQIILSIATLSAGDYTLFVIINDVTYEGEFSK